jgi:glycerophosphoryl diester phosphodiesterase
MKGTKNLPRIFGHRGAAGLVAENTLASIRKAIELGVDYIEIDVWKTTDNEVIVFHDAYLDRVTFQSGFVAEMDYPALSNIKLKEGNSIPTLKEVIELVKPAKIPLLVEVKAENAFQATMEILENECAYQDFIIGSFYHKTIMELKIKKPELRTAIMFECVPVFLEDYLNKVDPDYVVVSIETHDQYLVETVRSQHRKLVFYTVNSEPEIALALKNSPYGIVTNFPDRFLKRENTIA